MLAALVNTAFLLPLAAAASIFNLPNTIYNGSIIAQSVSTKDSNLDGPKLAPGVNDTSYDW